MTWSVSNWLETCHSHSFQYFKYIIKYPKNNKVEIKLKHNNKLSFKFKASLSILLTFSKTYKGGKRGLKCPFEFCMIYIINIKMKLSPDVINTVYG